MDLIGGTTGNWVIAIAAGLILNAVGIAFCFWGKVLVEKLAFILFGVVFGIFGLLLGMFLAGYLELTSTMFYIVVFGLCLLGIVIGALLGKFLLKLAVIIYCCFNAFLFVFVISSGMTNNYWVPYIAGTVAAIIVVIIVGKFFEKILAFVTAFFGASLVGLAVFLVTLAVAFQFFDYTFKTDLYYFMLIGAVLGVIIVLGIAGTVKQLSKKQQPAAKPGQQRKGGQQRRRQGGGQQRRRR